MLDLFGITYFTSQMLNPMTANNNDSFWLSTFAAFLVPLLYMFHAPAGGQTVINKTTVVLFLLIGLLFVPATSIELVPAYATRYYTRPMDEMGVSIFQRGVFLVHIEWIAIILFLQELIALSQLRRAVRYVHAHGAHYSPATRAVFVWDFNCGFFLAVFFFVPLPFWQQPLMRWAFLIIAMIIIAVGCILIFFGFDLNPVSDDDGKRTSISEFVQENKELINRLRYMLEEEQVYLKRGIQADMVIQQLGTNFLYFDRIMDSQYGVSFPEYVHRARIRHAQELIANRKHVHPGIYTPVTLDTIAQACGYENTTTFIHLYRRITGEDPSELLRS